ncbi:hypothetical protein [Aquabacterium sp.]|uniref:hypothetical protein n=1 Tax=Aquabacterium sp. TaxID=1872578 RepID=UPI003D6D31D1
MKKRMNPGWRVLTALVAGICVVCSSTAFGASGAASSPGQAGDNRPEPIVVMVPLEISSQALASGCWVQFYDDQDYKGTMLTLLGPAEFYSWDKTSGRQFKNSIDSLVLGPKAHLQVFEHRMFKDRTVQFSPNSREASVVKKLGFGGRIESMKLICD